MLFFIQKHLSILKLILILYKWNASQGRTCFLPYDGKLIVCISVEPGFDVSLGVMTEVIEDTTYTTTFNNQLVAT
jgi:hypothetical protein